MKCNTQEAILNGARLCFFRHGYKASNMTLISQYAEFSRATLHKHFTNKDSVFRAVCSQYQVQCMLASQDITRQNLNCWDAIEQIMDIWSKSAFEEVNDKLVYKDLHYYVQQVAEDIFQQAHDDLEVLIADILNKGINEERICLDSLNINSRQLAFIVIGCLDGIRSCAEQEQMMSYSHQTLNIFKHATTC